MKKQIPIECTGFAAIGSTTKKQEYLRSIDLFEEIFKRPEAAQGGGGVYYALAFLYDSQYGNEDLKQMMELCKPKPKKV